MKKRNSIILIGLTAMQNIAVKSLVDDCCDKTCIVMKTLPPIDERNEISDIFIVSVREFLIHPDYYMPRRNSVCIVDESLPHDSDYPFMTVTAGESEESVAGKLQAFFNRTNNSDEIEATLSHRETDVLKEIVKGKTNKEIADTLCISVNTVITHRKNISAKLGIKSVSGLSLYAMMNGLI